MYYFTLSIYSKGIKIPRCIGQNFISVVESLFYLMAQTNNVVCYYYSKQYMIDSNWSAESRNICEFIHILCTRANKYT